MTIDSASIPRMVVETYFRNIRELERNKVLEEVAWRRAGTDHPINSVKFERMSPSKEKEFVSLSDEKICCYPVTDENWASEQVLSGDYALKSMGKDTLPDGYLTFGITTTGDAIIMQVQGKKDRRFTPKKRNRLVQTTLNILKDFHIKRVFLINGQTINAMRREPNPDLSKRYADIAEDNGFNQEMWGLPYVDLN